MLVKAEIISFHQHLKSLEFFNKFLLEIILKKKCIQINDENPSILIGIMQKKTYKSNFKKSKLYRSQGDTGPDSRPQAAVLCHGCESVSKWNLPLNRRPTSGQMIDSIYPGLKWLRHGSKIMCGRMKTCGLVSLLSCLTLS